MERSEERVKWKVRKKADDPMKKEREKKRREGVEMAKERKKEGRDGVTLCACAGPV